MNHRTKSPVECRHAHAAEITENRITYGATPSGAVFAKRIVARVRVISGDTPIGPDDNVHGAGKKHDVVAMDDIIYGEPRAIN